MKEASRDFCQSKSGRTRLGIVIERKYAGDGNLEAACAEALKQIGEKKYAAGLKRGGLKKVICCGIAFWKKNVWL
ncbi:MAG: PD-(D/E)XK nuclease domain-containing protein [Eisenbergiella sp.]